MLFLTNTLCQPEIEPSMSPASGNTRLTCAGIIIWNFNLNSSVIHIWIGHNHIWIYMDNAIWECALYVG